MGLSLNGAPPVRSASHAWRAPASRLRQPTRRLFPDPPAAGAAFLHDLGLGDALKAIGNPAQRWEMRTTSGAHLLSFSAGTAGDKRCPRELLRDGRSCFCFVLRAELRQMLVDTLPKARSGPAALLLCAAAAGGRAARPQATCQVSP